MQTQTILCILVTTVPRRQMWLSVCKRTHSRISRCCIGLHGRPGAGWVPTHASPMPAVALMRFILILILESSVVCFGLGWAGLGCAVSGRAVLCWLCCAVLLQSKVACGTHRYRAKHPAMPTAALGWLLLSSTYKRLAWSMCAEASACSCYECWASLPVFKLCKLCCDMHTVCANLHI